MGKRGLKAGTRTGYKTGVLIVYDDETYYGIVDRIANGEMLQRICVGKDMPTRKSFYDRMKIDLNLAELYEEAKQLRIDVMLEEVITIADDESNDDRPSAVYRANCRIKARQWYLSISDPDRFATTSKQKLTHEGEVPQPIINITYGANDAAKDGSGDQSSVTPQAKGSTRKPSD